jgi:hypothetical protein
MEFKSTLLLDVHSEAIRQLALDGSEISDFLEFLINPALARCQIWLLPWTAAYQSRYYGHQNFQLQWQTLCGSQKPHEFGAHGPDGFFCSVSLRLD